LSSTNRIEVCHITIPKASGPTTSLRVFILLIGPTMLLIAKEDFSESQDVVENKEFFSESHHVIDRIIG